MSNLLLNLQMSRNSKTYTLRFNLSLSSYQNVRQTKKIQISGPDNYSGWTQVRWDGTAGVNIPAINFQYDDPSESFLEWRLGAVDIRRLIDLLLKISHGCLAMRVNAQVSCIESETLNVPLLNLQKIRETRARTKGTSHYIPTKLIHTALVPYFFFPLIVLWLQLYYKQDGEN